MATVTINLPAIEFRNVSLSFNEKPVLTDINFTLERGEMIFITGVSGSGKSVLLRLAMALDHPDSGQVLIEGQDVGLLDEQHGRCRTGHIRELVEVRPLGDRQEVTGVSGRHALSVAGLLEALGGILANGFEHPDAVVCSADEALLE